MITLRMEKQCGCFRKSNYNEIEKFTSKEEANIKAQEMCEDMNESFCNKHNFSYAEENNEIIIKMKVQ